MQDVPITTIILTNRVDHRFTQALESALFSKNIIVINNIQNFEDQKKLLQLQKKYSFSIVAHPKKITNFSKVKNNVLNTATTEWVFFLDSDEMIPESAQEEIQSILSENLYDAIKVNRTDFFLNKELKYGEAGTITLTRMFKKSKGTFIRNVHETVEVSGKEGTANFEILHYSHLSIRSFLEKISFYSQLDSKNKKHSIHRNTIEAVVYPLTKFGVNYFLKLGFLDGMRGLLYAVVMSLHSFFVRVYFYEQNTK